MADDLPEPLESSTELLTIKGLIDKVTKLKKIDLNPIYQRDIVWNEQKMSAFVDSLMRGYIPSNITISIATDTSHWTCIDGKQRITSILNFCKNDIPWIRQEDDDDDQHIYFSCVPDGKKDNRNCTQLDKKQQKDFLEKSLIIVSYNDLDYNMQCEIFNRIQNAMSSTTGERMFSLFKNSEVASKFKQFSRDHDFSGKGRFRNVDILMGIMYMKKNREIKALTAKKEKVKFIGELDDMNEYNRVIKLVTKQLDVFFGDELFGHKDILDKKMTKNFIMVMFYMLSVERVKLVDLTEEQLPRVRKMLIKIWDKWNIVDGDINKERSKSSIKVLQKIEKLYEDNSARMANLDDATQDDEDDEENDNDDENEDNDEDDEDSDDEDSDEDSDEDEDDSDSDNYEDISEEESEESATPVKTVKGKQPAKPSAKSPAKPTTKTQAKSPAKPAAKPSILKPATQVKTADVKIVKKTPTPKSSIVSKAPSSKNSIVTKSNPNGRTVIQKKT